MRIRYVIFNIFIGALLAINTGCKGTSKDQLTSASKANSPKYTIGVEQSSSIQASIEKQLPKANIKPYPDLITAYFALQVGEIDALAYNEIVLYHTFNDSMSGLTYIPNDIDIPNEIVIGMNKHSSIPDLKGIINKLIDSLNAAGTLTELNDHWNKNSKKNPLISPKKNDSEQILRIATSADVPPFSFISENQIMGIDLDIIKLLEEKLNVNATIIKTERNKLVNALKNNEADLIISAFTKADEYTDDIDFSKPYYIGKTAFAVRQDNFNKEESLSKVPKMTYLEPKKPDEIYKLADLSGKFVGVQTGTTLDEQVQQLIKLPRIQYFAHIPEMTKALEQRTIDAIAVDYSVAETILKNHSDFSILKDRLNKDEFGIAIRKNSPLKARIDSSIKVLQKKGEIQRIKEKWSKNKSAVRVMQQDWVGNDTLIVGTEALYAPYEFYQWGELSGIDIDIMYSIGKMLNKNIKFADMNFDVLIPSLVNEKTDLCIAAMSITEERSNSIDFSIPYDKNESVIVVHTPQHALEKIGDSTGMLSRLFQNIQNIFN
ncbi:transporter substrate-binding domain-containing protein [Fibrobacter sp. UWB12]|uniref:transporter substrate-binding domain-containing protein n=1 Tax=Fibrobacter sp. UWB12 TaxID=1896203 RepID=UPI0009149734|nr:transporter substrate-binding domain-containing protein [Fibrobacter sp. UWB12]SHK58767.1 polar amino acid transport system substrate-binding protein [Fibrobacter sp. UWB12]